MAAISSSQFSRRALSKLGSPFPSENRFPLICKIAQLESHVSDRFVGPVNCRKQNAASTVDGHACALGASVEAIGSAGRRLQSSHPIGVEPAPLNRGSRRETQTATTRGPRLR